MDVDPGGEGKRMNCCWVMEVWRENERERDRLVFGCVGWEVVVGTVVTEREGGK